MAKPSPARLVAPAESPFEPIDRMTFQERVYRALRKALILGRFAPGQALTVSELAVGFETSPMPVREALARLVSEQALETASNRSVRVPSLEVGRLEDLSRARRLIECAVLELAAPRLAKEDFRALRALNEGYARIVKRRGALAVDEVIETNYGFHFRLYGACGSPTMMRIVEGLWLQSGALVRSAVEAFEQGGAVSALHFHAEIVDALERGDVANAKEALVDDIGRAFALVRARLTAESES
jgi:DNA-binding GntR family transcriptional regulator